MDKVLLALEKQPVGIAHLRRSCPDYVRVIEYDRLPKKGSLAQVFGKRYKALIVLYELHDSKYRQLDGMGHYACILKRGKGYEYFSSYGLPISAEIAQTHSDPKRLHELLGKDVIVNRAKLQSTFKSNTCGRWAYARATLADLPLKKFIDYFGKKIHLNKADDTIALCTIFAIN